MPLSRGQLYLLAAFAVIYTSFLAWYHCPYAGGSDSSGYLNSTRLILEGRLTTPVRAPGTLTADILPRVHMMPLGFRLDATQENLLPTYPVGLPLHFAAFGWLIGLEAATTVVGVGSALACALLLFFICREFGVNPRWSLAVALLAALSPLTILYALQPMSDLVATCWALAVILCALRSSRHAGWAAGAGAALAIAVIVRPTNVLLFLPAALALHRSVPTWFVFGLGGLPGALFLAAYNHALYGTYLTSGYGDVSSLFAAKWVPMTLAHYARWVPVVATPLVFAAFALPWLKLDPWKKATLLAWAGSVLLFYSAYECTHETWWYLRFILPALPALGIAAALVLQRINYPSWFLVSRLLPAGATPAEVAGGSILRLPVTLLLLAATAGWMVHWGREFRLNKTELEERVYRLSAQWVNEQLPRDALLAVFQISGSILYYTDRPFVGPNYLAPEDFARLDAWLERERRPLYAVLFPFEEAEALRRMPGRWEVVTRIRQATVWRRLGPPAAVENPSKPAIVLREVTAAANGRNLPLSLLVFPGNDFRIRVIDNAAAGDKARFQTVAEAMESTGCLAGCNGGFFERKPFTPVGLMVSGGQRSGRFDPESWMKGLLVVRDKVATLESTEAFEDSPAITELIQSGTWLVRSGRAETDNSRTQVAKRTFICHDARGTWALGVSESCTLHELAAALKSAEITAILNIQAALNLDGGPSTGLWLKRPNGNFYLPERWPVRNYVGLVPSSTP